MNGESAPACHTVSLVPWCARGPCVLLVTENGMGMRIPFEQQEDGTFSDPVGDFGKSLEIF